MWDFGHLFISMTYHNFFQRVYLMPENIYTIQSTKNKQSSKVINSSTNIYKPELDVSTGVIPLKLLSVLDQLSNWIQNLNLFH